MILEQGSSVLIVEINVVTKTVAEKTLNSEPFFCRAILMAKVTNTWLAYHKFKPIATEDPLCRGEQYTLNLSRFKRPPVSVMRKLGEEDGRAQMSSSSFDHGSKLRCMLTRVLEELYSVA
ncbi:hypothetical protein TNCV_493771 [Trichonephila clavipes]|nr:hypothetical protein TNCV_493771 [Trichonephila clavipes]